MFSPSYTPSYTPPSFSFFLLLALTFALSYVTNAAGYYHHKQTFLHRSFHMIARLVEACVSHGEDS